jgi:hypothetical protein
MNRELIGRGFENTVYKARTTRPLVLKVPHYLQQKSVDITGGTSVLRKEIAHSEALAKQADIFIPPIRIIKPNHPHMRHILVQEYIVGDTSVNIGAHLRDKNAKELLGQYEAKPSNFVSRNGVVYMIDPTRGPIRRVLEEKFHIKADGMYVKLKRTVQKILRQR